nr:MAG TPA: hypothetical protein [Caudoviricetes sp.]
MRNQTRTVHGTKRHHNSEVRGIESSIMSTFDIKLTSILLPVNGEHFKTRMPRQDVVEQ